MKLSPSPRLLNVVLMVLLGGGMLWLLFVGFSTGELFQLQPAADTLAAPPVAADTGNRRTGGLPELGKGDIVRPETSAAAPGQAPPPTESGLLLPVQGVRPEELVDTFGEARSAGHTHEAIDIMAPRGTPVLAATDGRLLRLFTSDHGGLTLYQIGPDSTTVYYYAHLDGYAEGLREGQTLQQGQVLGYVGDTGNAVPGNTHLHFAIWTVDDPADFWNGPPINPYPLLR